MPWHLQSATITGNPKNLQPGDAITFVIANNDQPDQPETNQLIWGYNGTQNPVTFLQMARRELHLLLRHLNQVSQTSDVFPDFVEPP